MGQQFMVQGVGYESTVLGLRGMGQQLMFWGVNRSCPGGVG